MKGGRFTEALRSSRTGGSFFSESEVLRLNPCDSRQYDGQSRPEGAMEIVYSKTIQWRQQNTNTIVVSFCCQNSGQKSRTVQKKYVKYLVDLKYLGRNLQLRISLVNKLRTEYI